MKDESPFQGVREGAAYRFVYERPFWRVYRKSGDAFVHRGLVAAPANATLVELIDEYIYRREGDDRW